ncbi:MarR family transcriptional regulator [Pseudenhygromyxa sp. WMMC2535]|uniref:MarR family transcriptional regulator n=1 Tax=Pseudenhygromyxa sp. WMMC2535 TaxID=2712867 RepID=UPI0015518765|nr:MarR family transcriptional regulator [Pseudenhygromyxa sp. WMMC2535]
MAAKKPTPDRELVRAFATFFPAYRGWLRAHLPETADMTAPRMRLLGALRMLGPRKMGAVGAHLGIKKANVTALVDGLERDGLVRRVKHPRDRRATILELTQAGDELSAALYDEYEAGVAGVFEVLTRSEQRQLLALLGRVIERVNDEG